jgi:Ca2+-binding RTX toxin-like protein
MPARRPSTSPVAVAAALAFFATVLAPPAEAGDAADKVRVVFKNGKLTVVGTTASQHITILRGGRTILVKVGSKFFRPSKPPTVKRTKTITVRGKGGNDVITIDESGGALPPATMKGGSGDDTLLGGTATDVAKGGPGDDLLVQSGGDDTLNGEGGNDSYLLDADGIDAFVRLVEGAGGGADTITFAATTTTSVSVDLGRATQLVTPTYGLALSSSQHFEDLVGGAQADMLRGGSNDNVVRGGDGDDLLTSSEGRDALVGQAGGNTYAIDGDLAGDVEVVETGGAGTQTLSAAPTTASGASIDASATSSQAVTGALDLQLSSGTAFDDVIGGPHGDTLTGNSLPNLMDGAGGDDTVRGGGGADVLVSSPGENTLHGEGGDDTYSMDGDEASVEHLVENTGGGVDTLNFDSTTGSGVDVNLADTTAQAVTANLDIQLNTDNNFENLVGTSQADRLAGSSVPNQFTGGLGGDTYVHHGAGDGIDTITTAMTAGDPDRVEFDAAGTVSANDLTLDSTATQLRDAAIGTWGFDFAVPVLDPTPYRFGTTDTATQGLLYSYNGTSSIVLTVTADTMLASYATNGGFIVGAAGDDRLIDRSPNGNTLIGRDGQDVLIGGAGADSLEGDHGLAAGASDTYTGGAAADTFLFGEAFGGGLENFAADTVADFGDGTDTIDLFTGLSVRSGLGTTTVTIWDGATDYGTITASNGHLWVAGDFS